MTLLNNYSHSLSTIGLLQELSDPETLKEENAIVLVDAFVESQGMKPACEKANHR
jgi:hypothetical protein